MTTFYLADSTCMTAREIKAAREFDECASLCHRHMGGRDSEGRLIQVYSLYVPERLLRIHPEASLVNDDNAPERTIGDLLESMGEQGAVIKTVAEIQEESMRDLEFGPNKSMASLYILREEAPKLR